MKRVSNSFKSIVVKERCWTLIFTLLLAAIIAGGAILAINYIGNSRHSEIIFSSPTNSKIEVYLSGDVINQGIYTLGDDVKLADVIQSAGGKVNNVDLTRVKVYVLSTDESPFEQKPDMDTDVRINVNMASANELETLPGIGPARAQAIISYRNEKGYFKEVDDLINVKGIGPKTLENMRSMVKVVD